MLVSTCATNQTLKWKTLVIVQNELCPKGLALWIEVTDNDELETRIKFKAHLSTKEIDTMLCKLKWIGMGSEILENRQFICQ